jgi:hypothetical protein
MVEPNSFGQFQPRPRVAQAIAFNSFPFSLVGLLKDCTRICFLKEQFSQKSCTFPIPF